jgi:AcrR family transcriptional regulator
LDPFFRKNNGVTRERILDQSEALFAQKGFHAVSVREITRAARCNLAAVNYHFGSKRKLYLAVFRYRWLPRADGLLRRYRRNLAGHPCISTPAIVQSLAAAFLSGPLGEPERKRHLQLIYRELVQPTEALEMVSREALQPLFADLMAHLREVVPEDAEEERLALDVFSIFALVLYFNNARPLISNMTGRSYDADFKSRLVEHIVDFALNGFGAKSKVLG